MAEGLKLAVTKAVHDQSVSFKDIAEKRRDRRLKSIVGDNPFILLMNIKENT